jgi:predicted nucleic acid-binding protein
MSDKPLVCVIDANVVLKLFFVQPLSDAADALFAHLEADARARFYAPDFFYAECASALVNYVRLMKYPPDDAKKDLAELYALALKVVPTADLASQALNIALAHRLNGYDAFYVALSERVNAFDNADEKLVTAMKARRITSTGLEIFRYRRYQRRTTLKRAQSRKKPVGPSRWLSRLR